MRKILITALLFMVLLSGCKNSGDSSFEPYFSPVYFDEPVEVKEGINIEVSHSNEGYFAVSISAEGKYKIQVVHEEERYNYDICNDDTVHYFPFSLGDGDYTIRIMKNIVDAKYLSVVDYNVRVKLDDEFQPFLHSNELVDFSEDDPCIKYAAQIAAKCSTDAEFLQNVYDIICKTLTYDDDLAATVQKGYIPNPQKAWERQKGICYDYASLAAAMLRSQGVPCKLITGYLDGDYYHAWNMIYLHDEGWVLYHYNLTSKQWSRVDITMEDAYLGQGISDARYAASYIY